jgi:putative Holliday junction resolvase
MQEEVKKLKQSMSKGQRLLGLDVGSKTIGLALSDNRLTIASPLSTVRRKKFTLDAAEIIAIMAEHDIGGLVVGLPLNMDGSEGPKCQSIRQFKINMAEKTDVPICFWDERLSTVAVTRTLIAADTSRAKRKLVVDKMAACFILQGALDSLN